MTFGLLPGADHKQVAVEGARFAVAVAGPARPPAEAVPVVLLHGVPQTSVAFRFLLPELAKDRRVLAPDLKGLGDSEVRGPYDLPTLVRELAALVLHEVDGPVDVVGHDWGGSIAIALAAARPDLVRRLVVVNAPYRHINWLHAAYIPFFCLPVLPELTWAAGRHRLVREVIERLWKAPAALDPIVRTHYERVYTDPERVSAMLGYYRDNVRPRAGRALRRTATQVAGRGRGERRRRSAPQVERSLVVWGAADPILRMDVAEAAVRDLGADATLVAFPGVGHFPLEEAPDDVVPVIAEFLRDRTEPLPLPPAAEDGTTDDETTEAPTGEVVDLEMPITPAGKASGRDPDAQRASGRRRVAEVKAETRERAAKRRAGKAQEESPPE